MLRIKFLRTILVTAGVMLLTLGAFGCGGGGGNGSEVTGTGSTGGSATGDNIVLSINGQSAVTYNETSGFPLAGGYDPRIDFASSQVIMYRGFNGSDFDVYLDFMFLDTSVGDYFIANGNVLVAYLPNGTNYSASMVYPNSNGIISVTRNDGVRFQGTFDVDMVNAAAGTGAPVVLNITGSFDVKPGHDL